MCASVCVCGRVGCNKDTVGGGCSVNVGSELPHTAHILRRRKVYGKYFVSTLIYRKHQERCRIYGLLSVEGSGAAIKYDGLLCCTQATGN